MYLDHLGPTDTVYVRCLVPQVDVVMQNAEAGSPLDFLARFAGPLAWLVAGLLLLFGGVGGAGPAGPGGPGETMNDVWLAMDVFPLWS